MRASTFILIFLLQVIYADKPNVLFIAVDDLRTELGCYGNSEVKTPNIDRLAASSVVFEKAYCNIPVCGASRASLMTSIYPTSGRYTSYLSKVSVDTPGAVTLPQVLKENGYTTLSRGKIFHSKNDTASQSWSGYPWSAKAPKWLDPETGDILSSMNRGRIYEFPDVADNEYKDGKLAEKVVKDLKSFKESGKPFFIACGFIKPHLPFYAPKKYWDLYDRNAIDISYNRFRPVDAPGLLRGSKEYKSYYLDGMDVNSDEFHRVMKHGYLACVSYVDKLIGDILNELKRLELDKNTIVVLWGDHGWHLGEHNFWGKHNLMHHSTRIPLIVKVPGIEAARSKAMIESIDIFPTLCSLVKVPWPSQVQGRSFKKILSSPDSRFRYYAYSRYGSAEGIIGRNYSFAKFQDGTMMLYDHRKDPEENINVASDPKYSSMIDLMLRRLEKRLIKASEATW